MISEDYSGQEVYIRQNLVQHRLQLISHAWTELHTRLSQTPKSRWFSDFTFLVIMYLVCMLPIRIVNWSGSDRSCDTTNTNRGKQIQKENIMKTCLNCNFNFLEFYGKFGTESWSPTRKCCSDRWFIKTYHKSSFLFELLTISWKSVFQTYTKISIYISLI